MLSSALPLEPEGLVAPPPAARSEPPRHQRYEQELKREDLKLEFSPALEVEFGHYKTDRSIALVRLGCLVTVFLYLAAVTLDFIFHGRLGAGWHYISLFLVLAPISVVPALATYHARWRRYTRGIATAATVANAVAVIGLIALLTRHGVEFPHTVLAFTLMFFYFLSGLMFRSAFPLASATVVLYGVVASLAGMAFPPLLDYLFVLGGMVVLGGIACYLLEWTERRNWLRGRLVEELSQRDDLTGLHNRRYFYEQGEKVLGQAQREQKRVGLLLMDVDFFKQYNDGQGHLGGDDCLRRIGEALRASSRRPLDLLARLGGDEFVMLSYDQTEASLGIYAEQVRASIEQLALSNPGAGSGRVTLSIGATLSPASGHMELERLVAQADGALYRGKALGRNRVSVALSE